MSQADTRAENGVRPQTSTILVVDDEETIRHMLSLLLSKHGYEVITAASAAEALKIAQERKPAVMLSDVRMPEHDGTWLLAQLQERKLQVPTVMMSAYVDQDVAVECLKLGARDYISKPFKPDEIVHKLRLAEEALHLQKENQRLRGALHPAPEHIIGGSQKLKDVVTLVNKVASYKSTVLLLGESGTGKELLARLIHDRSPRAKQPFVAINCGAIPETLLESELFGYVKGAFTDANRDKLGLVQEADGGTLFLDEVGDLPLPLQVKLLRFLQEEEFRPVGGVKNEKVDVRVVAATARSLNDMVQDGSFREDLFYRLNVLQVTIPPLRERREDIPALAEHFVNKYRVRLKRDVKGLNAECQRALVAYDWPGNVRELENAVEQAMVLSEGDWLTPDSLPDKVRKGRAVQASTQAVQMLAPDELSIKKATRAIEEHLIRKALERTKGNRTRASELLEISHRALLYKMKEFGVS